MIRQDYDCRTSTQYQEFLHGIKRVMYLSPRGLSKTNQGGGTRQRRRLGIPIARAEGIRIASTLRHYHAIAAASRNHTLNPLLTGAGSLVGINIIRSDVNKIALGANTST